MNDCMNEHVEGGYDCPRPSARCNECDRRDLIRGAEALGVGMHAEHVPDHLRDYVRGIGRRLPA